MKSVVDMSPGPGKFAQACLDARVGYLGICFTEEHATELENMLSKYVLDHMSVESHALYAPLYAKSLKPQDPEQPEPKPAPMPKAKGKSKAKAKAKVAAAADGCNGSGDPIVPKPAPKPRARKDNVVTADNAAGTADLDGCGSPLDSIDADDDDDDADIFLAE